jgi:hypothetical protein
MSSNTGGLLSSGVAFNFRVMNDIYTRNWIIDNSIEICEGYVNGVLTIRGLHYQLVGLGMTNDINHYKRVVSAMKDARWKGLISFEQFSDLDREMVGSTYYKPTNVDEDVETAKEEIKNWMLHYSKNRWENQDYYPEVLIEKKALQGVFERVCSKNRVALGACKGYPSLTFLNDLQYRMKHAELSGKIPIIIYFGDYDPSGEDIPRSIIENLDKFGVEVNLERVALSKEQVLDMNLPIAPAKTTDVRSGGWDGLGQVELDAVKPEILQDMCQNAIDGIFDFKLHAELKEIEEAETVIYRRKLKEFVSEL